MLLPEDKLLRFGRIMILTFVSFSGTPQTLLVLLAQLLLNQLPLLPAAAQGHQQGSKAHLVGSTGVTGAVVK